MKRSPLLPIFLVVLVDILGFTIVYPLLPFYAERFGASPLVATTLVSVYALCSLFSTPVIGRLSDQFGRRRLLLISQAGTCAGFLVLGGSQALWMVFLGRILDGVTAGNLSIAQAYISDHTEPQNRAKAFGVIGIAFGIGFFFGPAMAGWLSGYGLHVPFLIAACLSVGSMVCTYTLLEPGRPTPPAVEATAATRAATLAAGVAAVAGSVTASSGPGGQRPPVFDLAVYLEYFRRPGLGALYLQFFLFTFSFSAFMSGFALFAERRFTTSAGLPWTSREVGYLFAYTGLLGIILQGGVLGRLVKRLGELRVTLAGFVATVIAYFVLGFAATLAVIVVVATIAAFGNGVLRPVITSLITQGVGRHEQGVAIGISGSLSSLAMTIAPPTGGTLLDRHWLMAWALVPTIAAALGLIVAVVHRSRTPALHSAAPGTGAPSEPAPAGSSDRAG
ncbi:MAG TPA: MFS transporter [Kofleriaceae bacterium]|nr:MFS transporter [Kofleriaceae bacterium]